MAAAAAAKASRSLAAQLAELGNAAPTGYEMDSDPEALDAGRGHDSDSDAEDAEDEARSHARHNLVDVAQSKMRKRANFIESLDDDTLSKYEGVKATRKEMLGDDDDVDEEEDDDDEDDENDDEDDEDDGSDNDAGSYSDVNGDIGSASLSEDDEEEAPRQKKTLRFADEAEEEQPRETINERSAAKAAEADAALLAELKRRSREDAQRGRDARKQMDAWGKLLGIRIRGQKVFRGAGRISTHAMASVAPTLQGDDRTAYDETLASLDQLSANLFQLQDRLLRSYASTSESDVVPAALEAIQSDLDLAQRAPTPKRKLNDDEYDRQVSTLFALQADLYGPMWREVLTKWSWRTSPASVDDTRKAKNRFDGGLKAVNQSPEEQIERGLTGDAYERLRKRTRVWRGTEKEERIGTSRTSQAAEEDSEEDAAAAKDGMAKEEADVFDDSDFYSALLRELIDSKGGLSMTEAEGASASAAWAQAAKRAAKKHRAVDRKASKGRRLRYDVHEKVENFMPPIPTETWSVEQIDRLVRQLRSGQAIQEPQDTKEDGEPGMDQVAREVELGGLRLFG